jgi:hypothetical protein
VLESLPSGTIPRSSPGPPARKVVAPPSFPDESAPARKLKRNRSIKGTRGERVENGAMRTWEWKGMVHNVGVKVGGCSTQVLIINVSVFVSPLFVRGGVADEGLVIGLLCV